MTVEKLKSWGKTAVFWLLVLLLLRWFFVQALVTAALWTIGGFLAFHWLFGKEKHDADGKKALPGEKDSWPG